MKPNQPPDLIVALLRELPPAGSPLSEERLTLWLDAARNILHLLYDGPDEEVTAES